VAKQILCDLPSAWNLIIDILIIMIFDTFNQLRQEVESFAFSETFQMFRFEKTQQSFMF